MIMMHCALLFTAGLLGYLAPRVSAIVDGADGDINVFQFFGYLTSDQFGKIPQCGATLITNNHILTLASCTTNWQDRKLFVQFGLQDWCNSQGPQELKSWAYISQVFLENTEDYPLAIASLKGRIVNVSPIAAPETPHPVPGAEYALPGFGRFNERVDLHSCTLKTAQLVPISPHQICRARSGLLCTQPYFDAFHKGSMCYGDQGGPLVELVCVTPSTHCQFRLRGVAAYSQNDTCGGTNVFRDVYAVTDWINRVVKASLKDVPE